MDKPIIVYEFRSKFLFNTTWCAHRKRSNPSLVFSKTLMPLQKNLKWKRNYDFTLQPTAETELKATLLQKHVRKYIEKNVRFTFTTVNDKKFELLL